MKQTAVIILRTVIVLLVGITIGILISNGNFPGRGLDGYNTGDSKMDQVLHLLKTNYVDSVHTDTIETAAIDHVLQNLDPHSLYLPAQQAQSVNERLEGGFDGVGITYLLLHDTLAVTEVYPGGPAAKAGIRSGDRIITVDHQVLAAKKLTLDQVWEIFKGKPNTTVTLGVLPWNSRNIKDYILQRGHVILSSLDAAYLIAPQTGYIKISKFASTTDADFKAALKQLQVKGIQKLILDLRGNGGGYLNAATALADEYLTAGKLIVYTQGLHEHRTDYFSTDSGLFENGQAAILIDEHSASASEILAGALQDLDRAVIIGRRSFGKGLVQEQFPFNDGSAINLTVARYYTPSGRSIQKSYKNGIEAYHNDLYQRALNGELYGAKNRFSDSVLKSTSPYHTASGKKVYSGGGIMPDVFVPENKALSNQLVRELNMNQLFTAYAVEYMQPVLAKYNTPNAFASNYQISGTDFTNFIVYASHTLPEMDSQEIGATSEYLKRLIKANAIKLKWGNSAYYQYLNGQDMDVKKGIEIMNEMKS